MALVLTGATIVANDSGNVITKNLTTSFSNLNSFTFSLENDSGGFSMPSNGRIRYQGLLSAACIVSAKLSLASITYGTSVGLAIYKNGSQLSDSISYDTLCPEVINFQVSMSNNDYVEIYANATQSMTPAEIIQCQMSIFTMALI